MSGVTRVRAHAGWELRLLLRNGEQILLMFIIPIALLIALRILRGNAINEQVATVLTVSLIATCFTSLAIGTGFERRAGALKFLATTPLSRLDLLLGKALATGLLAALSLAALAIVAAVMGWRPDVDWFGLAAFVILGGGAFAALAVLLAGALRAEAVLALANGIFVLLVVFGGVGNLWGTLVSAFALGVANKFLEPVAGAVLAKIFILVLLILFIQKRPRGLFALKGRAVEA